MAALFAAATRQLMLMIFAAALISPDIFRAAMMHQHVLPIRAQRARCCRRA